MELTKHQTFSSYYKFQFGFLESLTSINIAGNRGDQRSTKLNTKLKQKLSYLCSTVKTI